MRTRHCQLTLRRSALVTHARKVTNVIGGNRSAAMHGRLGGHQPIKDREKEKEEESAHSLYLMC